MRIPASKYIRTSITLDYDYCKDLVRLEIAYTRLLQIKQRPDLYTEEYYEERNDGIRPPVKEEPKKAKRIKHHVG